MNIRVVNNRHISAGVLLNFLGSIARRPKHFRYHVIRQIWQLIKESAAPGVENITLDRVSGLEMLPVEVVGSFHDHLYLAAVTRRLAPKTVFEFGTYLGHSALIMARNSPQAQIYTLDLPDPESRKQTELEFTDEYLFERWDRGAAFRDQPEAARIQTLQGDSATFDFSPYQGKIDLAFVDASHSYSYVKADTEAALRMLTPGGAILWHDYPTYPGIYAYLNELAAGQKLRIVHPLGSGLAIYSRRTDFLLPEAVGAGKK